MEGAGCQRLASFEGEAFDLAEPLGSPYKCDIIRLLDFYINTSSPSNLILIGFVIMI